jgi:acyl-CoA thioester hydrolase
MAADTAHQAPRSGMEGTKSKAVFRWPLRVYYEDTDAGGVVYYANYLRFFERARTEWLRHLGFELTSLERDHCRVFVVRSIAVDYRFPARLSDELEVTVDLRERGHSRLRLAQDVVRGDVVLCSAQVMLACLDTRTWRPVAMPPAVAQTLARTVEEHA